MVGVSGAAETGVCIMRMEAGLDSGPMLLRVEEPIGPEETGSELAARLAEIGAEALVEALALLEDGQMAEEVQDHSKATYAPKLDRETARIDWTLPAVEVSRWIRGLDEVPGAWSPLGERGPVKLFRPRVEIGSGEPGLVIDVDAEGVLIACGDGAVRVLAPGSRHESQP